jgi:hypothetical protein
VIVAGWTFSYLKVNYPYTDPEIEIKFKGQKEGNLKTQEIPHIKKCEGWVYHLQQTLQECSRVLASDGLLIILESRGVAYNYPTRGGMLYYLFYFALFLYPLFNGRTSPTKL